MPYGFTWWLDTVTGGKWEALVIDDYRVIFPLPRVRRLRVVSTITPPPYTQQFGPFGNPRPEDISVLLNAVPRRAKVALALRPDIDSATFPARFQYRKRTNFVLGLEAPYATITKGFPKTLQALLRKCVDDRKEPIDPAEHIRLSRELLGNRKGINPAHFLVLESLMRKVHSHKLGSCYQLREKGELLAAGFFPRLAGRTINLATVSTPLGRKSRGMSRLLALVMREEAGTPGAKFDFEGSELPGVREYFAKFGGEDEGYWLVEEKGFGLL